MAKMFSLGNSLKSRLKIGFTGSFSFNWAVVGRASDFECQGFPFPIILLGDRDLLCTLVGLAERGQVRPDLEVRPVLPPPRVVSWDA
jgi:hypothetical protein